MNIIDIIEKKRDKKELTKEEIEFIINEYTKNKIADYQVAALLMAIYLNGMNEKETAYLTMAMANSGDILELSTLNEIIVDKHSTGGVGDKVSLVLLPLVASLGVPVAKMSGRGLGITGGTADKLESIPGYNTNIEISEFIQNVKNIGISMITQTLNLAPADKKIYALRDSIACVESIPLIASSIMSKKIASGAQKIVLDVTVGAGAFMKDKESAEKLAKEMIQIGKIADKETICILTNMEEPLGYAIGNSLEVIEAVNFFRGEKIEDLEEVVLELGAQMIKLAGKGENIQENKLKMLENIKNGKGYSKFLELVKNQGGDISYIEDTDKFPKSKYIEEIYSQKSGYVESINAEQVGRLVCSLGAGRIKKDDKIDNTVGIVLNKKVSDQVTEGEKLATIYANSEDKLIETKNSLLEMIKINNKEVSKPEMILGYYF